MKIASSKNLILILITGRRPLTHLAHYDDPLLLVTNSAVRTSLLVLATVPLNLVRLVLNLKTFIFTLPLFPLTLMQTPLIKHSLILLEPLLMATLVIMALKVSVHYPDVVMNVIIHAGGEEVVLIVNPLSYLTAGIPVVKIVEVQYDVTPEKQR